MAQSAALGISMKLAIRQSNVEQGNKKASGEQKKLWRFLSYEQQ